ncbi:MAG: cytochrome c-type biogenesis CcmF C-terminal domain-containing protein, partial [Ilumatobacteraceae bacterium]
PSVRTGLTKDVYLTIAPSAVTPVPTDRQVTLRVFIKPMILWLWIGGAVMVIGTILAAFPGGRRRRPTEPVSQPIAASGDGEREGELVHD